MEKALILISFVQLNDVTYRMKSKGGYQDHSVDSRLTPNGVEINEAKRGQEQ